jgi:hypothetical protein
LFKISKGEENKNIKVQDYEIFHAFVAKGLFLAKRARLEVMPCIASLIMRVMNPT